jgi:hypothetical protein
VMADIAQMEAGKKMGRRPKLTSEQEDVARRLLSSNMPVSDVARTDCRRPPHDDAAPRHLRPGDDLMSTRESGGCQFCQHCAIMTGPQYPYPLVSAFAIGGTSTGVTLSSTIPVATFRVPAGPTIGLDTYTEAGPTWTWFGD